MIFMKKKFQFTIRMKLMTISFLFINDSVSHFRLVKLSENNFQFKQAGGKELKK